MSIVDLGSRITDDWETYKHYIKSSESYVYVEGGAVTIGPASLNLTVGDVWYDCSKKKKYKIPSKGVPVKPGDSIIITTKQRIAVPYNVFGVVFGTGKNIFKGGFVSCGRIHPGFCDKLNIGYYNGSNLTIVFEPDDLLACCSFFDIETTVDLAVWKDDTDLPEPDFQKEKRTKAINILKFIVNYLMPFIAIIVSIAAIVFQK